HQRGDRRIELENPEHQIQRAGLPQLSQLPDSHPVLLRKAQSLPTINREEPMISASLLYATRGLSLENLSQFSRINNEPFSILFDLTAWRKSPSAPRSMFSPVHPDTPKSS